MEAMSGEQLAAARAAGWTEEEVTAFARALVSFRDGLPTRQRAAFSEMLATAGAGVGADDAGGYLLRPFVQPLAAHTIAPPNQGNQVVIAIIAILIG